VRAADHWEEEAARWIAWARAPGHDAYWYYRDDFFALVPRPGRATLEVGCGEGRVARDLAARGHRVIAVDLSPTLIAAAREVDASLRYVLGDGAALPVGPEAFDLVVAYNSLMDVDDMPAVVAESARVLAPGGHLCVCVTHPLLDAGRFVAKEPGAAFVIEGSYFGRRPYAGTFERDGLRITFRGWSYALDEYARALDAAGFVLEVVREPQPARDAPPRWERDRRIPNFLMWRAVKRAA
jgi:SAM-dependent methyltransferase